MADVTDLEDKLRRHAVIVVDEAADLMVTAMQDDEPVASGLMVQSTFHEPAQDNGDGATCEIVVDTPYAGIVDSGRGAIDHRDGGKVLRWNGADGIVFSYYSGPVAPNPFFSERMPLRWSDLLQNACFAVVTQ